MAKVRNRKRNAPGKEVVTPTSAVPIGERLRHARESRGLEIAIVAEQLHLKQATVRALEEEDFSRLPARVFIRGYYRNYARLMGLPEEALMREFDARCPEGEECAGAPPVVARGVRKEIRSNHGLVKLVTWLVVMSLFVVVGLWWKDYAAHQAVQVPQTATPESPPAEHPGPGPRKPAMEATAAEPVSAGAQSSPNPPAGEVEGPVAKTAAPPEPEAEAAVPPEPPPEPVAPPGKRVEMRFDQDSWVDVRGANGSFKLVGTRKAGETLELGGEPPWKIIIGNARGVTLLVDGKPRDFSARTRRNVARLTLER